MPARPLSGSYMRILFHICCGPCAIVPLRELLAEGHAVDGALVNPNIHPTTEFEKRNEAARTVAASLGVRIAREDPYGLREFLRAIASHEDRRCPICYRLRLQRVAALARAGGYDAFTTSMLVSTHQDHDEVRRAGEEAACEHGVAFLYRDFRPRVMDGVRASKEMGIYRQRYCGCILSECERFGEKR